IFGHLTDAVKRRLHLPTIAEVFGVPAAQADFVAARLQFRYGALFEFGKIGHGGPAIVQPRQSFASVKTLYRLRRFGQIAFRQFDQLGKRVRVVNRQIGQRLAVQLHQSTLQAGNEFAVADAAYAACRVDAYDPEPAELPLSVATIAEGVSASA